MRTIFPQPAEASSQNIAQEKRQNQTLIADTTRQTKRRLPSAIYTASFCGDGNLPASARQWALYKQSEKLDFDRFSRKLFQTGKWIISLTLSNQRSVQPLLESVVEQYAIRLLKKLSLNCKIPMLCCSIRLQMDSEALANIVDNASNIQSMAQSGFLVSCEMICKDRYIGYRFSIPETEQAKIFARFLPLKGGSGAGRGSASAYTWSTDHIRRGRLYQDFPFRERKYVFHISARNNNNSIKTVRFHFFFFSKECGKIPCDNLYVSRIISFHTHRFFHGGTHLWEALQGKNRKRFMALGNNAVHALDGLI